MYQKALVAFDGSPPSLRAVASARELAEKDCIAELTIINVVNIPHPTILPDGQPMEFIPKEYYQETISQARRQLEEARQTIAAPIPVKTIVESGTPAETILRLAEKERYDLIIVGSRGLNPLERLLLGSVSRKIVSLAQCTVMIVR